MLNVVRWCVVAAFVAAPVVQAQEGIKPGPEHAFIKKSEGNWECTVKAGPMDSKATVTSKMELGGLWLVSTFEGDFGGQKFSGRSLDSFDPMKKKYTSVWIDSMSGAPMLFEGTYDEKEKTLTMIGDGPGPDGKPAKWKSVTKFIDDDNHTFTMFMGDSKEAMMVITYKRKK